MNERIKEFAEEANILRKGCSPVGLQGEQLEKFAELIIQECIKIVEPDAPISAMYIENHFGVE